MSDDTTSLLFCVSKKTSFGHQYIISLESPVSDQFLEKQIGVIKKSGTKFTLYLKRNNDQEGSEVACITYEKSLLGINGPRKMSVLIPPLLGEQFCYPKEIIANKSALERMKNASELVVELKSKLPSWCEETSSYILSFNGRVSQPSIKNFQLVHPRDSINYKVMGIVDYIVLSFGKMQDDLYSLDFSYPMSIFTAFGIAITSFETSFLGE